MCIYSTYELTDKMCQSVNSVINECVSIWHDSSLAYYTSRDDYNVWGFPRELAQRPESMRRIASKEWLICVMDLLKSRFEHVYCLSFNNRRCQMVPNASNSFREKMSEISNDATSPFFNFRIINVLEYDCICPIQKMYQYPPQIINSALYRAT